MSIKKANKKVALYADYQSMFASPMGINVLHDLMKTHYVMGSTFDVNTNEMILKEGERNVVLRILHILKINTKELLKNIEDANREE